MRFALVPLLVLTACTPSQKPEAATEGAILVQNMTELPPPEGAPRRTCDASRVQEVIGKPRSDVLAEDARVRAGAKVVRYLTPDVMVTMEFRDDRLNLHVGTDGRIGSARRG